MDFEKNGLSFANPAKALGLDNNVVGTEGIVEFF
jgi:hypothetical protein